MNEQNELTEIILAVSGNYNLTRRCVDSVLKNSGKNYKLIIVDNGIKETELLTYLSELTTEHNNVRLVVGDYDSGYSAALNKGIENSNAKLIAILNNSVIVSKNWLEKLKNELMANPVSGIIAPMCNNRFIPNIDVRFAPNKDIDLQLEEYNTFLEQGSKPSPYREVPYLLGYCMLMKKEVIDKCGGFDPIYGNSPYFSDFDLCFRAASKGFKLLVSNNTVIYRDNSDLADINNPQVNLPVNYTVFSDKWRSHELYKYIPKDMFPLTYPKSNQV
jgi:GT2 family glycosyltransferase